MTGQISITAAYAFFSIPETELERQREELINFGAERAMKGLVLLATEGINATVCGSADAIGEWKDRLRMLNKDIIFKDSTAEKLVFKRWSVKIKPEIVTLKQPTIHPQGAHRHLSPSEWQAMLERDDVVVLDARNNYEVAIGKFRNAIDPQIRHFSQLPAFVQSANIPKEKKVLMYCTGGIRCEKAVLAMEAQGYTNVYQLDGGILAYLQQFPDHDFEGECFVFDQRVAVDQTLQPSQTYRLCRGCGDPCKVLEPGESSWTTEVVCPSCMEKKQFETVDR